MKEISPQLKGSYLFIQGLFIIDKKRINHENTRSNTKKYHEFPTLSSGVFVVPVFAVENE